jgi:hypothetical protein
VASHSNFEKGEALKNLKRTSHFPKLKGSKSWTLLVIGELGNVLSLHLTKPLIAILAAFTVAILAFVVFFTVSYYEVRTENKSLKEDLDKAREDLVAADKAKEMALVRLMVLEGEVTPDEKDKKPLPEEKPRKEIAKVTIPPVSLGEETKDVVSDSVKPVAEAPTAQPEAGDEKGAVASGGVLVDKLEVWQAVESHLLEFQFIVKNIDPKGGKIKGYTFVVLEPKEGSEEPLAVFPLTPLKDGKPAVAKKGQYFSISRFKPVSGTFPDRKTIEPFETATIYVYSEAGSLLVEQVYEIDKVLRGASNS